MQFLTILPFLLLLSCQSPTVTTSGIQAERITFQDKSYDIIKVNLKETKVQMHWSDKDDNMYRSIRNLKTAIEKKESSASLIMNGGMYLKDGSPQGLYIEKGKEIRSLDTLSKGYGNFYLQPNGVFYLTENEGGVATTKAFQQLDLPIQYATQSGPMLVADNAIHSVFRKGSSNLHIRNGVGQISATELVFIISNERVNLYEFAELFKNYFHCPQALYLDGFVSRAYIPELKRYDLDGSFGVMVSVVND